MLVAPRTSCTSVPKLEPLHGAMNSDAESTPGLAPHKPKGQDWAGPRANTTFVPSADQSGMLAFVMLGPTAAPVAESCSTRLPPSEVRICLASGESASKLEPPVEPGPPADS